MDRNYWEQKGGVYDAEIFDVYAEDRGGVVGAAIRRLVKKNDHVADLGCGTGKALPLLVARACSVEAVDLSDSCLREARRASAAHPSIRYRRADLAQDRSRVSLDFILSVNVLIMPDASVRKAILKTFARRLKTGARCLMVVPSLESSLWVAQQLFRWEIRDGAGPKAAGRTVTRLLGDRFRPALAEGIVPIDGVATKHYLREELTLELEQVGLRIVRTDKVEYGWHTEFADPPAWMREPYPWDWMVEAEKTA